MSDFEDSTQKELDRLRLDKEQDADNTGFQTPSGDEKRWSGTEDGPYVETLGRASSDGTTGLPTVGDGKSQRIAVDEYGRIWTRSGGADLGITAARYTSPRAEDHTPTVSLNSGQTVRVRNISMLEAGGRGAGIIMMLFDKASAPVNGDTPIWRSSMLDAGAGYFNQVSESFQETDGIIVATGFSLAMSTTIETLTYPASPTGYFQMLWTIE